MTYSVDSEGRLIIRSGDNEVVIGEDDGDLVFGLNSDQEVLIAPNDIAIRRRRSGAIGLGEEQSIVDGVLLMYESL